MAASGFTPISLYYSTTAAATPSAGNLVAGELALNTLDEKLYFKNSAGTVKLLASNAGSTATVSSVAVSGGTTGLTTSGGPITTSGTITLAGTLASANGGTGQTAYTTGDIIYASATNTISKLGIGSTNQVLTVVAGVPAWAASTGGVTSFSAGTTGFTPSTASTGAVTLAGTLATTNGGTNLTSFTSGGALYATSTSVLTTGTLPVASGGTGLSSTPANGALDIGNGTGFTRTTITAGTGISVTNGSGSITIAASGGSGGTGSNLYLAVNFGGF